MKNIEEYGLLKEEEREALPWLSYSRPPFKIWVKPEDIKPFFLIEHHPYSLSLLLKMNTGFKRDIFQKVGRKGTSKDWEILCKNWIKEYEEYNSGEEMFYFDSDEAVFCVFSEYIDDLLLLARELRKICNDEKEMISYLK